MVATKSAGTVTAVSLQIGSNDELNVVGHCESPAYDAEKGFSSLTECLLHEASEAGFIYEGGLFKHILTGIGESIGVLRSVGYGGKVLLLNFYNPNATLLAGSNGLQKALDEALEGTVAGGKYGPGVKVADVFSLINPEAALAKEGETTAEKEEKAKIEGKTICKYTEMCPINPATGKKFKAPVQSGDIHPTKSGYTAIGKIMAAKFAEP
jgi:hypothetical protein